MDNFSELKNDRNRRELAEAIIGAWQRQAVSAPRICDGAGDFQAVIVSEFAEIFARQSPGLNSRTPWTSSDFRAIVNETMARTVNAVWPGLVQNLDWLKLIGLKDFQTHDFAGLEPPQLMPMPEGATWPNPIPVAQNVLTASLATFAAQIFLSEQIYLNDTTGIFVRMAEQLVLSAAEKQADISYEIFQKNANFGDGQPWLNSAAGNTAAAPAAFDQTSFTAAVAGLRNQVMNDMKISLAPKYLLVDPAVEIPARQLAIESFGTDLTVIANARLSGMGFYLIADPAHCAACAKLTLAQGPGIEAGVVSVPRGTGLLLRCRTDFAAAPLSRTGIYWTPAA